MEKSVESDDCQDEYFAKVQLARRISRAGSYVAYTIQTPSQQTKPASLLPPVANHQPQFVKATLHVYTTFQPPHDQNVPSGANLMPRCSKVSQLPALGVSPAALQ